MSTSELNQTEATSTQGRLKFVESNFRQYTKVKKAEGEELKIQKVSDFVELSSRHSQRQSVEDKKEQKQEDNRPTREVDVVA